MEINNVAAVTPAAAPRPEITRSPSDGLGQEAFMQLLLAQLQNQDPLKPMEDKDFIAQLAQFNSLNELTQINKTLSQLMTAQTLSQGSALIGKQVTGLSGTGETIAGIVTGLRLVGGKILLDIGGQSERLPLETVQSVEDVVNEDL